MHGFKGEPFTVLDKKMLIRDSAKRFLVNWTHLGTSATGQHVSLSGLDFAELFEFFKSLRCLLLLRVADPAPQILRQVSLPAVYYCGKSISP